MVCVPGGSEVRNLPAKQETQVQSLAQEDPLEKGTHSSILAWKILWTEEPGRQVWQDLTTKQQQCVSYISINLWGGGGAGEKIFKNECKKMVLKPAAPTSPGS